jgi:hypothetical protein
VAPVMMLREVNLPELWVRLVQTVADECRVFTAASLPDSISPGGDAAGTPLAALFCVDKRLLSE